MDDRITGSKAATCQEAGNNANIIDERMVAAHALRRLATVPAGKSMYS